MIPEVVVKVVAQMLGPVFSLAVVLCEEAVYEDDGMFVGLSSVMYFVNTKMINLESNRESRRLFG